jgi:DNA replication ATP-dependent helicase Dna2
MSSTADLLNRLRPFVQAEAETQYASLDRQWSRPLSERVAKGWAIEGLQVEHFEKGLIWLRCDTNDSRFREGDLLVLHRGNPKDPNALHVELQYDRGRFARDAEEGFHVSRQNWPAIPKENPTF